MDEFGQCAHTHTDRKEGDDSDGGGDGDGDGDEEDEDEDLADNLGSRFLAPFIEPSKLLQ